MTQSSFFRPRVVGVALLTAAALALNLALPDSQLAAQDPPRQPAQPGQPGQPGGDNKEPDFQLVNRIVFVLPRLLSPRQRERVLAARELQMMPPEANSVFLKRLPAMPTRQKLEMLDILATRKAPGTPKLIVQLLPTFDEAHDRRLLHALRCFGPEGWEALRLQLFGSQNTVPAPDAPRQPRVERLYVDFVRGEVLALFQKRLSNGGVTGYYREQFQPIFRYGSLTIDLLDEVARGEGQTLSDFTPADAKEARKKAVRAIGDSGHPRARAVLQSLYDRFASGSSEDSECREAAMHALYVVGEKSYAQPQIDAQRARAERSRGSTGARAWYDLAHIYLNVNEYPQALDAFERLIAAADANGDESLASNGWYNMACIHSRLSHDETTEAARNERLGKALQALRTSAQAGFANWEWIFRDGDLANLWAYEGFKKWIAELRADPLNQAMVPNFEPGHPPEDDPDYVEPEANDNQDPFDDR